MINTQHLSFTYATADGPQITDISLKAASGEAIALLGGDGSGRSTLLYLLAGLAPGFFKGRREGSLEIAGQDPQSAPPRERLRLAAIVFAEPSSQLTGFCPSVEEEIAWGLGNLGVPVPEMHRRVENVLKLLRLEGLRRRCPLSLSSGQQQLTAFASVLVMEPRLLLCDECASRLTGRARLQLIDTVLKLSGEGHTVVWASSSLEEAARFPRWIYLDKGRIAYDGPPRIADHDTLWAPWTRLAAQAEQRGLWQGELPVSEEQTCVFWRTRE